MSEDKKVQEKEREELAKEFNEKLKELQDVDNLEQLIRDNKIEFKVKETNYRVRKPNFKETSECNNEKMAKKIELLENPKFKLRQELIKLYKKNGVDILAMEAKIKEINAKIEDLLEKLATTTIPSDMELLEKEINQLKEDRISLILEKNEYLDICIENQVVEHANLYMVYLITEKKVEDKWIKAFKNYNDFLEEDEVMIKATNYLSYLIYRPNYE